MYLQNILQLYNQQIYNGAKRLSGYSDQSCWCLVDNLLPVHSCTAQYSGLLGGTGQQGLYSRTFIIFQPAVRAQKFYSFIFLSTGLFRILALDYDITRKKCLFIAPRRGKTIYKKYLKYASEARIFRNKTTLVGSLVASITIESQASSRTFDAIHQMRKTRLKENPRGSMKFLLVGISVLDIILH